MSDYGVTIAGERYEVLDSLNNITLADSFVKNKIGGGHGEAKLCVGNENERYREFFDDIGRECFFLKKDFKKYLLDAKEEFDNPQQDYVNIDKLSFKYTELLNTADSFAHDVLKFHVVRVGVAPPRVYLKSDSEYYEFMREAGLPNISYISIMKLRSRFGKIYYYYRIFIDYKPDIIKYESPMELKENEKIMKSDISERRKTALYSARIGQGEYRRKLLEDCMYCPFTMVNDERLLIASHIKPWVVSNDKEKVDPKNGFALTPTYDKLFDRGFITFGDDKTLSVSPWINPMNQKRLNIYNGMLLPKLQLDEKRSKYLIYHRENVFQHI